MIAEYRFYYLSAPLESPYLYGFGHSSALKRGRGRLHGGWVRYTYMYNYTEVVF